jgi:hypothetical protein
MLSTKKKLDLGVRDQGYISNVCVKIWDSFM